jgi:hypothetical protein
VQLNAELLEREAVVAAEQATVRERQEKLQAEIERLRRRYTERSEVLFRTDQAILRIKKQRKATKESLDAAMTSYLDEQVKLVFQEVELEYRKRLAQGEQKLSTDALLENKLDVDDKKAVLNDALSSFSEYQNALAVERREVAATTEAARRACLRLVTSVGHAQATVKQTLCRPLIKYTFKYSSSRPRTLSRTLVHLRTRVAKAREAVERFVSREMTDLARTEELAASTRREFWRVRSEARDSETAMDEVLTLMEGDKFFAPDSHDLMSRDQSLLEYRRQQKEQRLAAAAAAVERP